MSKRMKQTILALLGVAALAGSSLMLGERVSASQCTTLFGPGNIFCPGSPSPGYHFVGANGDASHGQVAVYYGEGSSTNWRAECWAGSGSVFVDHGASASFTKACPSDKQYIKLLKCGDSADCQN
jgi:hypothetical protein